MGLHTARLPMRSAFEMSHVPPDEAESTPPVPRAWRRIEPSTCSGRGRGREGYDTTVRDAWVGVGWERGGDATVSAGGRAAPS